MAYTADEYRKTFNALTVPLLRARAAEAGICRASSMNKAQLVECLAAKQIIEDAHAEALEINEKLTQVARLEAHGSVEARLAAYSVRDEILAAGFEAQAVNDVPKIEQADELGPIEETDGRCPYGAIHEIETCFGCGTEDENGNQVSVVEPGAQVRFREGFGEAGLSDMVFTVTELTGVDNTLAEPRHFVGLKIKAKGRTAHRLAYVTDLVPA